MSRETLEFHHDKHHLAYVDNANNLMKGTEFDGRSVDDVVRGSFFRNPGLFNNAGQHYNHIHFWKWMKPGFPSVRHWTPAKPLDEGIAGAAPLLDAAPV